jgi:uncharacterized membrane protein YoaK (UPF0700 family)
MDDELATAVVATSPSVLERGAVDPIVGSPHAQARNAELLAATLALIAGIITYGVFVSFMSGNTTQTGYQTAEGLFGPASRPALAILFFVVGAFAGTLLVQAAGRLARRAVFGVVAAALAEIIGLTYFGFLSVGFGIAIVSAAMAVMNSAFSRIGAESVSLTFVTGTLSRVGSHLAMAAHRTPLADALGPWDTHLRRAVLLTRVWAGFLAGALLSGAATPRFGVWVLVTPALILVGLAAFDRPGRR